MVNDYLMKPKAVNNLDGFLQNIGDYVFEEKLDGGSCEIKKHGDFITITHGSNPNIQNVKYPELIPEIQSNIKNGEYVVELCVLNNKGVSEFPLYLKRQTENKVKINFTLKNIYPVIAFFHDITKNGNDNITMLSWSERNEILKQNIKESEHIKIVKSYDKPDILLEQKDIIEGIVIKKRNSPYQFGKRDNWYKFRFNTEETVKCTDYEDTDTGIVLITTDGRRINLAGDRSDIARKKILEGGFCEVEIAYHERTQQGFRFTTVKRIVGNENEM